LQDGDGRVDDAHPDAGYDAAEDELAPAVRRRLEERAGYHGDAAVQDGPAPAQAFAPNGSIDGTEQTADCRG
jgi:hypothetical protein